MGLTQHTKKRKIILSLVLCFILLISTPVTAAEMTGENAEHPLISSDSDTIEIDYAANEDNTYPWYYSETYSSDAYSAYLAGNSGKTVACVSNISITVSGAGSFSFDYKLSTPSSGSSYALYYSLGEPITTDNYKTVANNYSSNRYTEFRGVKDWTSEQFVITTADLDTEGKATVYIAYLRNGTSTGTGNANTVAIANVCFTSGQKTLTLNVDGDTYGHVTAGGMSYNNAQNIINYQSGDTVTLTAAPNEGSRFYGWVDGNGKFLTTDESYSFVISSDTTLKAVFAPDGTYAAHRNGTFYTDTDGGLTQALADAVSGDDIVMLENQTLSANATIPAGAKLYIPYSADFDEDGNADGVETSGSQYQASKIIATADKTYRTLTVASGATVTVNGTLNIGSVISYPSQNYNGHTSGWHGKIANEGSILINSGGVLDCWGIIEGSGTVEALSGAKIYEPFIVYDFAGGSNTSSLYFKDQTPFKQYAMQNIQADLLIKSGATLHGRCNLWASSSYNKTDIVYIGDNGLYELSAGASVTRSYNGTKHISTNTDIGKTTYTFNGGMTYNYMTMPIMGFAISTEMVEFPIPYNIDLVLKNGSYVFEGRAKIMPGANLYVESDASLTINKTLFVLNGLIQSDMSGKSYPTTDALKASGFSGSGGLFVNGEMTIKQGAIFGGIIQTEVESSATVTIESGAVLNSANVNDGAVGTYDVNTSIFNLPAQAYVYDSVNGSYTLKRLFAGNTYTSYDASTWTVEDYTMTYAKNCEIEERSEDIPVGNHKWVSATVALNEPHTGSWLSREAYHSIDIVSSTVYDAQDPSRVVIGGALINSSGGTVAEQGELVFNLALTPAGKGYVHLVSYTSGGEPNVLSADAQGNYTISDIEGDVNITVTSCKLGDVNQDNKINSMDSVMLRKMLAGIITPEGLPSLAADTQGDAKINSLDLVILRKHLAGLHEF